MENKLLEENWDERTTVKFNRVEQKQLVRQTVISDKLNFTNSSIFQVLVALVFAMVLYYIFSMVSSSISFIIE
jgi:hypothetical protein